MQQEINLKKTGIGIALAVAIFFFYDTWCPIENIIGIPCPGCNMTSALYHLLHLDFALANYFHPLIIVFCIYVVIEFMIYIKFKSLKNKYSNLFTTIMVVLLITVWIVRMIYIFPNFPMAYNENNLIQVIINLF